MILEKILEEVAKEFKLEKSEILSRTRLQRIVTPRQVCVYIARKHTKYTWYRIAIAFSLLDHSNAIHASKTIAGELTWDDDLRKAVGNIETQIVAYLAQLKQDSEYSDLKSA